MSRTNRSGMYLCVAVLTLASALHAAVPQYELKDLGQGHASGIGDGGHVVIRNSGQALLWHAGTYTTLGVLPGFTASELTSVNKYGEVAGYSYSNQSGYRVRSFHWKNGVLTDLGTFGTDDVMTESINDSGQIVGACYTGGTGFLWDSKGLRKLPTLWGNNYIITINNQGVLAGCSVSPINGSPHLATWTNEQLNDHGEAFGYWNFPRDMNDNGIIVGYGRAYGLSGTQFTLYTWKAGAVTDLGTVQLNGSANYFQINNAGIIIGNTLVAGINRPFWLENGTRTDLADLFKSEGWSITALTGINNSNQLCGTGRHPDGTLHAILLTPKPTANTAPQIISLPTPPQAVVNQSVTFSASASDAESDPLTYSWSFGDGSSGSGQTLTHVFAAAGSYSVSLSVSDGQLTTSATIVVTVASLPGDPPPPPPENSKLQVTKAKLRLNFAQNARDSYSLQAELSVSTGFSPAGAIVSIDTGGAQASFTLDAKGRARAANAQLTLRRSGSSWRLSVTQRNGAWAAAWAPYGLVNADVAGVEVLIPVVLRLNEQVVAGEAKLRYGAKAGRGGIAQ